MQFLRKKNIKTLFCNINEELLKISDWFHANKLSLNTNKTKYILFHKSGSVDILPLRLPKISLDGNVIERETSSKFLGIYFDQNMTWNSHIEKFENKISKTIGIFHRIKYWINSDTLKILYNSFVLPHINYANCVWASTNHTKLDNIYKKQKHFSRMIYGKDRLTHSRPLMKNMNALNVFQINIYQLLLFMFKVKNNIAPNVFSSFLTKVNHKYPTKHAINNFNTSKFSSKLTSSNFHIVEPVCGILP